MSVTSAIAQESDPEPEIDIVVDRVTGTVERTNLIRVDAGRIRQLVVEEWKRYDDARVRHFVPVLVHRAVIERLTAPTPNR